MAESATDARAIASRKIFMVLELCVVGVACCFVKDNLFYEPIVDRVWFVLVVFAFQSY